MPPFIDVCMLAWMPGSWLILRLRDFRELRQSGAGTPRARNARYRNTRSKGSPLLPSCFRKPRVTTAVLVALDRPTLPLVIGGQRGTIA
jgi:hypothetical protein